MKQCQIEFFEFSLEGFFEDYGIGVYEFWGEKGLDINKWTLVNWQCLDLDKDLFFQKMYENGYTQEQTISMVEFKLNEAVLY